MTGLFIHGYLPFCRWYSRACVGDRPADRLYRLLCAAYFYRAQGYWPNLNNPATFMEHIWCKMLYDRNPLLTRIADKLAVREHVARLAGPQYLVDLLWSGTAPEDVPLDELPDRFVIKATHASGWNLLVDNKADLNWTDACRQLRRWLGTNYCDTMGVGSEWCYRGVPPALIVEAYLGDGRQPPVDHKFFCFAGTPKYMAVDFDRFGNHARSYYDENFNFLDFCCQPGGPESGYPRGPRDLPKPDTYDEMMQIARQLSAGFDFVRVDLYSVAGRVYFGELTNYHDAGIGRFRPQSYDRLLGSAWPAAVSHKRE